ncbi:class I SAM-dependent methyltransferase [Streptomyces sp. ICBB 8177]|uniref:class I SAM-dependent methyltransferase n=1 Tax=Streptomyces sp. ICBB 8177 TaxID=563922 RepID=UPI000D684FB2|nr:class I SAM-dependent methyltransferase [Streptomyces sp. ICBB 8177]PWI44798.1 SAM-dependent methyltransferase [Streptomyces sp. ICBB 8177]
MPILPSAPDGRLTGAAPHAQRGVAESYGADTERYDRTRPRYPDAVVERVVADSPGRDVLDVGTGTGIAGLAFQAAGCAVLGVEPDARMAEFARRKGLDVEVAKFEDWDPAGRTYDALISGTAWHWVDPVAGAVRAAEVLRPSGRLAVFWNAFRPAPELAGAFAAVYARVLPESPIHQRGMAGPDAYANLITMATDGLARSGAFGEPERWRVEWDRDYTREEWLDQMPTFGGHGTLPREDLDALLAGVGEVVDAMGGRFTMRYTTVVLTATRAS